MISSVAQLNCSKKHIDFLLQVQPFSYLLFFAKQIAYILQILYLQVHALLSVTTEIN